MLSPWSTRNPEFYQIKLAEDALRAKILSGAPTEPFESLIEVTLEMLLDIRKEFKLSRANNLKSRDPQLRSIMGTREAARKNLIQAGAGKKCIDRPLLGNVSTDNTAAEKDPNRRAQDYAENVFIHLNTTHWPEHIRRHVVIAGGAPLFWIMDEGKFSDYDMFIVGTDNPSEILSAIIDFFDDAIDYCIRTEHSVTLKLMDNRTVQIVLRSYKTPAEVVVGFDLDASGCCYYDGKVYCTPRALYSIRKARLHVDLDRMSTTYNQRLVKYAKDKGFSIEIPCEITVHHLNEALFLFSRYFLASYHFAYLDAGGEIAWRKILNDSLIGLLVTQFLGERAVRIPKFAKTSDYCPIDEKDFEKNKIAKKSEPQSTGINLFLIDDTDGIKTVGYGFRTWNLSPHYVEDLGNLSKYLHSPRFDLGKLGNTVKFITENPGTQFSASFHPMDMTWDKWLRLDLALPEPASERASMEPKAPANHKIFVPFPTFSVPVSAPAASTSVLTPSISMFSAKLAPTSPSILPPPPTPFLMPQGGFTITPPALAPLPLSSGIVLSSKDLHNLKKVLASIK